MALLLLLAAVAGGTLSTFLYSPRMPFMVRLCAGACTGMAIQSSIGFVAALWLGLTLTVLWISTGAMVLLGLFVLKLRSADIQREIVEATNQLRRSLVHPTPLIIAYITFYAAISLLLVTVFAKSLFVRADGIYTGLANNLGDLPFHLQTIFSFVYGQNFPPESPIYANVRFAYPFLIDFSAAMLVRAGASAAGAMWIQGVVLSIAFVGLFHYWTLELTRDRLAGFIAPILVLLSGGLGWCLLFQDAWASGHGVIDLLGHLPRRYTIGDSSILRWGNSLTTLFVPQRSFLFGAPIALVIFSQWWLTLAPCASTNDERSLSEDLSISGQIERSALDVSGNSVYRMLAAGILTGMLPLVHAHSYIVVVTMAACLYLLFRQDGAWLAFLLPAFSLGLVEIWWFTQGSGVRVHLLSGWHLGWDRENANVLWFWFVNTGAFIPLLATAILARQGENRLTSTQLRRFYLPFTLCFIVPNVVKMAPWVWDNIKILFYWFLASVPLVALLLSSWFKRASRWRFCAVCLLCTLTIAGLLDVVRVVEGAEQYREFDNDGIAIAYEIVKGTETRSLILHAPTFNSPVFLTGRRSLLGYPGHAWSHGLDYTTRQNDIRQIYAGSPDADSLIQHYHVDYALVGPLETSSMPVNQAFWSRFPLIARSSNYRLYKMR
jgi:hypothetical protein